MGKYKVFGFVVPTTWRSNIPGIEFGWGNGYGAVTKDHPLYGKNYQEVEEEFEVHGGLTFSGGGILGFHEDIREWVTEKPVNTDLWIFGFDTGHWGDNERRCTKNYVIGQTKSLIQQLENYG